MSKLLNRLRGAAAALGVSRPKDFLYMCITLVVGAAVTLIFCVGLYYLFTGKMVYNPLYGPWRANIQFPYLLGLCAFFMYLGAPVWFAMGIASIFYHKKPVAKASSEDTAVSVIIPACNEERVIRNIISDLLSQSYSNFEAIVVVHNSSDNTFGKATEVLDERIKVIEFRTAESGKALALNRGLAEASGELVATFDADNRIDDPDFLSKAVAYFEKDPSLTGIQVNVGTSNPRSSLISFFVELEYESFSALAWRGREVCGLPAFLAGTGSVLRRRELLEVGGWKNSLVEDFELFTRLALKRKKIRYADAIVVLDEKPLTWSGLFRQRSRWVKGHMSVTWDNLEKVGNPIDYVYRLSPFSVFAWWVSSFLYGFYFLTGQSSIWEVGTVLWVSWIVMFELLLIVTLWRRSGFKKAVLFPVYWFFAFHWTWVALLSLRVRSWSQTKTVHVGDLSA